MMKSFKGKYNSRIESCIRNTLLNSNNELTEHTTG